jgi:hypothetical protein
MNSQLSKLPISRALSSPKHPELSPWQTLPKEKDKAPKDKK